MALLAKSLKFEGGFPWFVLDALPGLEYQEMGADYIHAILNGYTKADDPQWNLYYPGQELRCRSRSPTVRSITRTARLPL